MAASDNLHPTLFHGTDAELSPGDVIKPTVGHRGIPAAFASQYPTMAQNYAQNVYEQPGQQTLFGHMYEVEPLADDTADRGGGTETISPTGFRVVRHASAHPITSRDDR